MSLVYPLGYEMEHSVVNAKAYFVTACATYLEAQAHCQSGGANLAVPRNQPVYREPSTEECLNFNRARWTVLRQRFPGLGSMPNVSGGEEGIEGDNGC